MRRLVRIKQTVSLLRFIRVFAIFFLSLCLPRIASATPAYYWRSLPVGKPVTAQLLTLFCQSCGTAKEAGQDIPLISILRDTLGNASPSNHRITEVWLLSYSRPTISQRGLAAIPFFYWSPSDGSANVKRKDTSPLLDLSAPEHPAASNVERQLIQWTALDTITTPVRASSRAYRTNEVDHERLHLEEANSYLLHAPVGGNPDELTAEERDLVMARLELRKKLLGGFVSYSRVASLGKVAAFEQERVRTRNWELLRQCAEKTGLVFEPVTLAGSDEQYGMLWYPGRGVLEPGGDNLGAVWKLLAIKNPYTDDRVTQWSGFSKTDNGVKLIPLGFYALSYPRQPLLLVDFRDKRNLRRRDITQKSIDEITSGIVGLSHFANWYYFVGSDVLNFIEERRGKAENRAERLDSYSEFRVALALDKDVEPDLRAELRHRLEDLSSNPLESSPANEMSAALSRYSLLTVETAGDDSRLLRRIDSQRREELAVYNAGPTRQGVDLTLHALTLGKYTHRVKSDGYVRLLGAYRGVEYDLRYLDTLVAAGTPPEIPFAASDIRATVQDLDSLMAAVRSPRVREHAQRTLASLEKISTDPQLQADCRRANRSLHDSRSVSAAAVPGIVADPAIKPGLEELK